MKSNPTINEKKTTHISFFAGSQKFAQEPTKSEK
jgi:hypothetical protein